MNKLILALILVIPFYIKAEFDNKSSVIITLRFQSNEDAYKDAITLIDDKTSNLSCVHRGKPRVDRQLK